MISHNGPRLISFQSQLLLCNAVVQTYLPSVPSPFLDENDYQPLLNYDFIYKYGNNAIVGVVQLPGSQALSLNRQSWNGFAEKVRPSAGNISFPNHSNSELVDCTALELTIERV